MKLNRQDFLDKLELVYPAIATNPVVAHYSYFKITKGSTDAIDRLQAHNGLVIIETILVEGIEHTCAIPAEPFIKLLRSLDDEEIELIFKVDEVKVKAKTVKGKFTILDEVPVNDIPISDNPIEDKVMLNDLFEGFKACSLYVNKDKTSGSSRGVRIDKGNVVGTDGFRVALYQLEKPFSFTCSVPTKFIDIVLKKRDELNLLSYIEEEGFVAVLNDGTQIGTKVLLGEYPPYLDYFPDSDDYVKMNFVDKEMFFAMDRHINFLSRLDLIDKEIQVHIIGDKIITTSKDELVGELIDEASISSDEELDVEFPINPIYLRNIVNVCSCFKYFTEMGLILLEADKIRYITQILKPE